MVVVSSISIRISRMQSGLSFIVNLLSSVLGGATLYEKYSTEEIRKTSILTAFIIPIEKLLK